MKNNLLPPLGFVLESADSVRFGDEFSSKEVERNKQLLFGEALSGLLMGEPIWTNSVFSFDSTGMVELLAAIAKAFPIKSQSRFMPAIFAVYPGDRSSWTGDFQPWKSPQQIYTHCFANKLNFGKTDFILSSLADLQSDNSRRKSIANELKALAGKNWNSDDLKTNLSSIEIEHFQRIANIDRYVRAWLPDGSGGLTAEKYFGNFSSGVPLRHIKSDWIDKYSINNSTEMIDFKSLTVFLKRALSSVKEIEGFSYQNCIDILNEFFKRDDCHLHAANRSAFRAYLISLGIGNRSNDFRVLTELADGHYLRKEQAEPTHCYRDLSSPASNSDASKVGEEWATVTLKSFNNSSSESWQFINDIFVEETEKQSSDVLEKIFTCFAELIEHPETSQIFYRYHSDLHTARTQFHQGSDNRRRSFDELVDQSNKCCDLVNKAMKINELPVEVQFSVNDAVLCQGSLALSFCSNKAIEQKTGTNDLSQEDQEILSLGTTNKLN